MENEPRKHHFLSQCYLKHFSNEQGNVLTLDFEKSYFFETTPKNIAAERDFNRILSETISPFYLEKKLSELENLFSKEICNVVEKEKFLITECESILFLMACYAIRNPYAREGLKYHINNMANSIQVPLLPEGSQILLEDEDGKKFKANTRVVVENGKAKTQVEVNIEKNDHIILEFEAIIKDILPSLRKRKWLLVKAPEGSFFITSESPVVLIDRRNSANESLFFKDENGILYFPLTSKFALVGEFGAVTANTTQTVSDSYVAGINNLILFFAKRRIFTPRAGFKFSDGNGKIINGEDVLGKMSSRKQFKMGGLMA